jgi:hypothetical protein
MTSTTLYREGDDLDQLLAELDKEHPDQVRVTSVTYPREGGVMGFFARRRVGVHYELGPAAAGSTSAPAAGRTRSPLAELIEAVDAAESDQPRTGDEPAAQPVRAKVPETASAANLDFARTLLELAAQKAAQRAADAPAAEPAEAPAPAAEASDAQVPRAEAPPPAPAPCAEAPARVLALIPPALDHAPIRPSMAPATPPAPPATAAAPAAPVPVFAAPALGEAPAPAPDASPEESRSALTLRRQLAELGVPIDWVPADTSDVYRAVTRLVARLPRSPLPPAGDGDVLAVVGPGRAALRAAETIRARMRLRPQSVWFAGSGTPTTLPADRIITDTWQAATVAAEVRLGGHGPRIVVVATDGDEEPVGPQDWAPAVLAALRPQAVWAVVDATRKTADTRAMLDEIGQPDALIVTNASRTCSPASVWELGVPTVLLDGAPANRRAWAVLLLDELIGPDE